MILPRAISGLVLAACVVGIALLCHGCDAAHRYPPDETCRSGAWVFHRESSCGAITGPLLCPAVDRVLQAGLARCPSKSDDLRSRFAAMRIDAYGFPVRCGGRPAFGCQDGDVISIDDPAAVVDETAHAVFEVCDGRTGENRTAQGSTEYDADFAAFVSSLRATDGGA